MVKHTVNILYEYPRVIFTICKGKGVPRQAEVAQGFPVA